MILNLFALKNRLSGSFEKPFAEIYDEKEYPELLFQTLSLAPVQELGRYKEYDLYLVGSFDTVSGKVDTCNVSFITSLETVCLSYLSLKEKSGDVQQKSDIA